MWNENLYTTILCGGISAQSVGLKLARIRGGKGWCLECEPRLEVRIYIGQLTHKAIGETKNLMIEWHVGTSEVERC